MTGIQIAFMCFAFFIIGGWFGLSASALLMSAAEGNVDLGRSGRIGSSED